ncbi:MAG: hypothetical protein KF764_24095 [Labilithrix sp.]|nr:hypothetical protein [Labilithrix sp.]
MSVVPVIVVACSSSDLSTDLGGKDTKDAASAEASSDKDADAPPAPKDTPPVQAGTCSASQGAEACFACCEEKNPNGAQVYDQAMHTCLCAPSACATECAETECAAQPVEPAPGDDCATCIDDATECAQAAETACAASAACGGLADCIEASGCEPEADGGT